jgi:hypothetical protein
LVSRQEPKNYFAWKVISLRHVSLREMGWSRKPYEFQSQPRLKSKGQATYGALRKHAFLASKSFVLDFECDRIRVESALKKVGRA